MCLQDLGSAILHIWKRLYVELMSDESSQGVLVVGDGVLCSSLLEATLADTRITHTKIGPRCRQSSCAVGNVGTRFSQGRIESGKQCTDTISFDPSCLKLCIVCPAIL